MRLGRTPFAALLDPQTIARRVSLPTALALPVEERPGRLRTLADMTEEERRRIEETARRPARKGT